VHILLVTGQCSQYHDWPRSSATLARMLDDTGLFAVTTVMSPPAGGDMTAFHPDFAGHDAVVLDYEGDDWPEPTRQAFDDYLRGGGGLVVVHASDNAFPRWPAFQTMIGVGGWGGRDESWGPKVRWRDGGIALDRSPGLAAHPPIHEFEIVTRAPGHPIMRGLPPVRRHGRDELYCQLRGPARNLEVLATASADPARHPKATGEHEPVLMTIQYGEGRVFHTTLGHVGPVDTEPFPALTHPGFRITLQRGTEWAASGRVTQPTTVLNVKN
jgi:hypothetical protein